MTDDQEKVLNHVTLSGRDWDAHQRAHCISKYGEKQGNRMADANLAAKVARWGPDYDKAAALPDYKPRAAREADEAAKQERLQKILNEIGSA